jgi:hypothetical protein
MLGLFRRERFEPVEFGPAVERAGADFAVASGPLAGRSLRLDVEASDIKAVYRFTIDGEEAGACHFDRDPRTGLENHWDIIIAPGFRGRRLASLMVRVAYRDLLGRPGRHWFAMRKMMKVDTRVPELHNIGIGLIAVKLGLRPEPLLDELLAPGVVKSVELLAGGKEQSRGGTEGHPSPSSPPGLLLHLSRMPGVIVAARLDAAGRPETDPDAYRRFTSPAELLAAARSGRAVVGNIDYRLVPGHIDDFCRHLARDPGEFRRWTRALRSAARHQEN